MRRDPHELELIEKLNRYIAERFNGSIDSAFAYYDKNGDGELTESEVKLWLADGDVGSWLTRDMWVMGAMRRLDADGSRTISLAEIKARVSSGEHTGEGQ